tara:strand:+ start:617 stop:850 length:234 start_codon:yes stop_codon:yes gene_type:complete
MIIEAIFPVIKIFPRYVKGNVINQGKKLSIYNRIKPHSTVFLLDFIMEFNMLLAKTRPQSLRRQGFLRQEHPFFVHL